MARIHADGVAGSVENVGGLSSSDQTLESSGLTDLPGVSSPDHASIALFERDPSGRIVALEIVHVTSHASEAASATIVRGQEGTSARAWDEGSRWSHGLTAAGFTEPLDALEDALESHADDTTNPHGVTASQAGASPFPHDSSHHSDDYAPPHSHPYEPDGAVESHRATGVHSEAQPPQTHDSSAHSDDYAPPHGHPYEDEGAVDDHEAAPDPHSQYADSGHDHDAAYAPSPHGSGEHTEDYADATHGHSHGSLSGVSDDDHHDPSNDPTPGQKNALQGTSGTPGQNNRYVTNQDSRLSDDRDPNVHGNEAHDPNFATDAALSAHEADETNPHGVTHGQVGAAPDPHGSAAHSDDYAPPHGHPYAADVHGDDAHAEDYADATHNHDTEYVPESGGTFSGRVTMDDGFDLPRGDVGTRGDVRVWHVRWGASDTPGSSSGKWIKVMEFTLDGNYRALRFRMDGGGRSGGSINEGHPLTIYGQARNGATGSFSSPDWGLFLAQLTDASESISDARILHVGDTNDVNEFEVWVRLGTNWQNGMPVTVSAWGSGSVDWVAPTLQSEQDNYPSAITEREPNLVSGPIADHEAESDPHSQYATDTKVDAHTGDTSNPHSVTASQAGAAPDPHGSSAHSDDYAPPHGHPYAADVHGNEAHDPNFSTEGHSHVVADITSGTFAVGRGGTGRSTLTSGRYLRGAGTSAVALVTPENVRTDIGAAEENHGQHAPFTYAQLRGY